MGLRLRRFNPLVELAGIVVLTLLLPLAVRCAQRPAQTVRRPYLPSLEGARVQPFAEHRLAELRWLDPAYVVIGDSMAGTRINEHLLGRLTGERVAPLLQPGSGPVFWYLAMKNWVIASGVTPRVVFIFFRDTNLTETLFRFDRAPGSPLDLVATDATEDEVDAIVAAALTGPWYRIHGAVERVYGAEAARTRLEPALTRAPLDWITSSRRGQAALLERANARFALGRLRTMDAADMAADTGTDFHAVVNASPLPLMLRDAARHGVELCLVRVQRRPLDGQPPRQSARLERYIRDLRAYVEARGGMLHDDTGDPAQTLDMYEDGDHIAHAARDRYTRLFFERLRPIFEKTAQ